MGQAHLPGHLYPSGFKRICSQNIVNVVYDELPVDTRLILQKPQSELKRYLSIEEQYWKQKAGMSWFAEKDINTRFFHNHVNGKRQKLQLKRIQNHDGNWIESQDQLAEETVESFQQ